MRWLRCLGSLLRRHRAAWRFLGLHSRSGIDPNGLESTQLFAQSSQWTVSSELVRACSPRRAPWTCTAAWRGLVGLQRPGRAGARAVSRDPGGRDRDHSGRRTPARRRRRRAAVPARCRPHADRPAGRLARRGGVASFQRGGHRSHRARRRGAAGHPVRHLRAGQFGRCAAADAAGGAVHRHRRCQPARGCGAGCAG